MRYIQELIVTYNGDLHDYEGYEWQSSDNNIEFEIRGVARLDTSFISNQWTITISYVSKSILDTLEIAKAFEREFKTPMRATVKVTPAEYQQMLDVCRRVGLNLNVCSIEE